MNYRKYNMLYELLKICYINYGTENMLHKLRSKQCIT